MNNLYELNTPLELWVPIKTTKFIFSLKESAQLPKLQLFLLSSIEKYDADSAALEDATLLSPNVIQQEMHTMYKQKLLQINQDQEYELTDLSRRLLQYGELIEKINESENLFTFNFVTGDLQVTKDDNFYDKPNGVIANKVVSEFEISCIEPLDIKEVLQQGFSFLNPKNVDLDDFLENVVIEPVFDKSDKWSVMYITHLPLDVVSDEEGFVYIKNYVVQREYHVYDQFFETNSSIMTLLEKINDFDTGLLSDKGTAIMVRWTEYQKEKKNIIQLYENPIDKSVHTGCFSQKTKFKKIVADMEQYESVSIDEEPFECELKNVPTNGFSLKLVSEKKISYISSLPVRCIVSRLGSENNDI